ncbi:MAG: hypothetical protein WC341_01855 [Bacteroidales bacterium]|jgi:hypothetical protein
MKSYYKFPLFVMLLASLFFASCQYDFVVQPAPPDPGDSISFSSHILPVFQSKCVSCHGGSEAPDLRNDAAYSSIQSMGLINTTTPADSKIYAYPNPALPAEHMWTKYTESEAALVLLWIEQGALNN